MRWLVSILIALLIWIVVTAILTGTMKVAAVRPGSIETRVMNSVKKSRIDNKGATNPHEPRF